MQEVESGYLSKPGLQFLSISVIFTPCLARPWYTQIFSFQPVHIFKREESSTIPFENIQHKVITFLIFLHITNVCLFIICRVKRHVQDFSHSLTEISAARVN